MQELWLDSGPGSQAQRNGLGQWLGLERRKVSVEDYEVRLRVRMGRSIDLEADGGPQ